MRYKHPTRPVSPQQPVAMSPFYRQANRGLDLSLWPGVAELVSGKIRSQTWSF